jgi:hypothetical protein
MRTLFLLLLLANLAFFAYSLTARERALAESAITSLQVSPEKIKPIKPGEGAGAAASSNALSSAPAGAVTVAPAVCIEWGALAGADVARADAALAKLDLPETLVQRAVTDAGGYWVYLPPVKSKAELDRRIGQLAALGITEFFVVQDATPWRNAISLGIFRNEAAAKSFLEALRAKGVLSAVAERRENFLKQIAYFVREPNETTVAKLAELQRDFPGTRMKAVACPHPGA